MTVSTTNTDFTASRPSALFGIISRVFTGLTAGYTAYLSFSNLNRMSDAQLADLGLTRMDVPRAAAADILSR